MERRFRWDGERIRFFCDAAENGFYHRELARLLAPELRRTDRVLDAGCGLGYLSEALLPYCDTVTAVDCDELAVAAMQERTAHTERLKIFCADVHAVTGPFDTVVCCYFGTTEEALKLKDRTQARKLILIKRRTENHRFSEGQPLHERTAKRAEQILNSSQRRYRAFDAAISFDQPFRSYEDAVRFFERYRGRVDPSKRLERIEDLCAETGDPVFPYRFPVLNEMRILIVE